MPWSKIKNIILVILAVTNLALLVLVGGQAIRGSRLLSQAREDAIQFLRNRGVEVDEEIVPQSMELRPQIVERDLAGEERAAAALTRRAPYSSTATAPFPPSWRRAPSPWGAAGGRAAWS